MARMIPKRVIEDVRFRSDIADVIQSYFTLQRAGANFKTLCPFHKEKTPSFHVNPQRQIFHCFGCGAGGDVFKFVMQMEGLDFYGAVAMLAQRAGIPIEFEDGGAPESDKALLYRLHGEVADLFHRALRDGTGSAAARAYLEKRALSPQTVEEFNIGYAPEGWTHLLNWAREHKYGVDLLEKAGLVLRKAEGSGGASDVYDRFRNRLMFPIHDEQSRVIGFSGRALDDADGGAKYINSPETPLFKKSRVLYALDKARKPIVESREAVVCEGQIDVIRCHQAGVRTAVASQGTAFTEEHVRILRRYADSVVIVFDTDKAGQEAAVRTAGQFLEAGLAVRVATLPEKEDPDSFIRKEGAEAFAKVIAQARSVVEFQVRLLSAREDAASEIGAMRIAKAALQTVSHSPNEIQRAKLIQEAARLLGIPVSAMQGEFRHLQRQNAARGTAEAPPPAPRTGMPPEEEALCEHMVHAVDCPELVEPVEKYLPLEMLSHPACRSLVKASLESARSGRLIQDVLRDEGDPEGELSALAARVLMAPTKVVGTESSRLDAVRSLILYIWRQKLKRERTEVEKKTGDRKSEDRRRQLTYDLKALDKWDSGVGVMELERGGGEPHTP